MIEIDPERLGKESTSTANRRRRCVGSVNLVRALREANSLPAQEPDSDAQSGTLVHRARCGEAVTLSVREAETLRTLERLETLVVTDWAGNDEYTLLGREVRLWLHQDLEPIHSGQFDVAYGTLTTRRMLILDYKTLFGEVSPAEENDQMRELVALARFNYPACESFTVAILQPWVTHRPSIAHYDVAEAELALRLLRLSIADAADPDAPRTPGAWCKHCPALGNCEEARSHLRMTYDLSKRIENGGFALPIGTEGARMLDSIETAETTLKALKASYKALITQEPDAVPGWYLREGNTVREITDVLEAAKIAETTIGLTSEEFLKCVRLNVGTLEEFVARLFPPKTGKEEFNKIFGSIITWKQNAPILSRESARKGRHKEIANGTEHCEKCGRELNASESVWLELNAYTGQWRDQSMTEFKPGQSQGWFAFGKDCAKEMIQKQLR